MKRRLAMRAALGLAVIFANHQLAGCAQPRNPSFDLTIPEAKQELSLMGEEPKPLERPLVVLSGFGDPGFASDHLRRQLGRLIEDDRLVGMSFAPGAGSFGKCRRRLIERVEAQFPSEDPEWTVEVDVVGNSMGGLVARYAAVPARGQKALKIKRLMTISSPHQGADLASVPAINQLVIDMRAGSPFLKSLNGHPRDYELVPYTRLGDQWVGHKNTALPGQTPWWVPNRPFSAAHLGAFRDPRFLADIARRLRGEAPFATLPRAPFPAGEGFSEPVADEDAGSEEIGGAGGARSGAWY